MGVASGPSVASCSCSASGFRRCSGSRRHRAVLAITPVARHRPCERTGRAWCHSRRGTRRPMHSVCRTSGFRRAPALAYHRLMPNNVASFSIHAADVQRARHFYEAVFCWRFEPWGPPEFYLIHTGDEVDRGVQGLLHAPLAAMGDGGQNCLSAQAQSRTSMRWRCRLSHTAERSSYPRPRSRRSESSSTSLTPRGIVLERCAPRLCRPPEARRCVQCRSAALAMADECSGRASSARSCATTRRLPLNVRWLPSW